MKNSIGIENTTFVRDDRKARRAATGAAALACPPEAAAFADAITICCFGQITSTTLRNMSVPNSAPVRIVIAHPVDQAAAPSGDSPRRFAMIKMPVRKVTMAPPRNQRSARGNNFWVAVLLVAGSASAMDGPCTKFEQYIRPIHVSPPT